MAATGARRRVVVRRRGTVQRAGRAKTRRGVQSADRLAAQLAVCGGAFVLLVAAKLLLPGQAAVLRQSLGGAMERNVDVRQVFSAVGRAVSGGENGEVWQAVFRPLEADAFAGQDGGTAAQDSGTGTTDSRPVSPDSESGTTDMGTVTADSRTVSPVSETTAADSGTAVQPGGLTASETEALADGTAYTVEPGRAGIALGVLRQYRPGNGRTERVDSPEQSGGTDRDGGANNMTDGGSGNRTDSGTDSGAEGKSDGGTTSRAGTPVLPEKVSMEQAILNFNYRTPVFGTLTSGFGLRTDPIQGGERFHHGVDLAVPAGTDILCFADGTVSAVGESTSYGKYCIVDHAGGCSTLYAHCSRITASSGASVSMGEKIAEAGSTGAATGPHLHFELHKSGTYLNPIYYVSHD